MFLFIVQLVAVLSVGGVFLMVVRKMPQLVALPETSSDTNWHLASRLFKTVKTPVVLMKKIAYEFKHAEKVDFKHEPVSQASKVDDEHSYWTDIRRK